MTKSNDRVPLGCLIIIYSVILTYPINDFCMRNTSLYKSHTSRGKAVSLIMSPVSLPLFTIVKACDVGMNKVENIVNN